MKRCSVSVAVGNIRGNPVMIQPRVMHDANVLSALAEVAMAVEIKLPRYNRAMRNAAKTNGQKVYFEKRPNQISAPASWMKTHKKHHQLSRGKGWIPQPGRSMEILFEDDTKIAYAVMHLTNGGWNRKWKPFKSARRKLWLAQVAKAQEVIKVLHDLGWTVVIGGDMNTGVLRDTVSFHPRQQTIARAGLMWLVVVPAKGVKVHTTGRVIKSRGIYTDHPFLRATLHVEAA